MSNKTLSLAVLLSTAMLAACSDSPDRSADAAQPVGQAPDGSNTPTPDNPPSSSGGPSSPDSGSGSSSSGGADDGKGDDEKGEEVGKDAFWDLYSQPGVWRRTFRGVSYKDSEDIEEDVRFLNVEGGMKQVYSITATGTDSATLTECEFRETDEISRAEIFNQEPEEDDLEDECNADIKLFRISDDALRIENHCEDGSVIDWRMDKISSNPAFAHGSLVYTAAGLPGGSVESDICGEILDVRSNLAGSSASDAPFDNSHALTLETYSRYRDGYLNARFFFLANLDVVEGVVADEEYQVGDLQADNALAADVRWIYRSDDGVTEAVFAANSGSVRILEIAEHTARISFNLSDNDGKSVIGEMTVNLQ